MTDTPFDPISFKEELKTEAIEAAKNSLIESIQGRPQDKAPESWSSFKNDTIDLAVSKAEERILTKIENERKAETERVLQENTARSHQSQAQSTADWQNMSAQWTEAVKDGILPDIAPDVKTALDVWQKGGAAPTSEQMNDPGVKAYAEVKALHEKLKADGTSSTFYRTIQKFYNKQPAGATAPVLGNSVATAQKKGFTYDEVHKENILGSKFRF